MRYSLFIILLVGVAAILGGSIAQAAPIQAHDCRHLAQKFKQLADAYLDISSTSIEGTFKSVHEVLNSSPDDRMQNERAFRSRLRTLEKQQREKAERFKAAAESYAPVLLELSEFFHRCDIGQPLSTSQESARGNPIRFKAQNPSLRDLPIIFSSLVRKGEALTNERWPFTSDEVLIACAAPAMNVIRVGGAYAALNGQASATAADTTGRPTRYSIEESTGRQVPFVNTKNNQTYRNLDIVVQDATDVQIGSWWSALNSRLLQTACNGR